ncbi:MAG: class I SAM-dependent methyltransferase [Candidatus Lokiarchaeota archaeon]|nr:class I SAM-dependent methyltransferase [Candidatus Lokiarchaeota archaeon]
MSENVFLKKDTVQETMLGPLWARATQSQLYPKILKDPKAVEILEKIEYDFTEIKNHLGDWRGLGLLVRAKSLDDAVKKYLETHPNATVINIAAGLDTTFYRVDNGKVKWYDLDLPDAIEYRKQFLLETQRSKYISKSAFDYSWIDNIEYNSEDGIFFIAGGFFYYFSEEEVAMFFKTLAEHFPRGEIVFDCISKLASKILNKRAKKVDSDLSISLGIGKPEKTILKWSNKLEIKEWFTMYERTQLNPNWNKKILKWIKISERLKIAKIVHVKFLK